MPKIDWTLKNFRHPPGKFTVDIGIFDLDQRLDWRVHQGGGRHRWQLVDQIGFWIGDEGWVEWKRTWSEKFFYIFVWWLCKTKFQVGHATFFLFCFTPRKWQRPVANTLKECRRNNASTRSRRRDGHVRSSSSCPTMAFSRFFRGTEKSFIETKNFFGILGRLCNRIRCFQNMLESTFLITCY